jgi:hypothetical protein
MVAKGMKQEQRRIEKSSLRASLMHGNPLGALQRIWLRCDRS